MLSSLFIKVIMHFSSIKRCKYCKYYINYALTNKIYYWRFPIFSFLYTGCFRTISCYTLEAQITRCQSRTLFTIVFLYGVCMLVCMSICYSCCHSSKAKLYDYVSNNHLVCLLSATLKHFYLLILC